MFTVSEVMSTELCTLKPDDNLQDARRLMTDKHIRHVPVVENGRLLGVVSHRDILAAADSILLSHQEEHKDKERFVALSEVMSQDLITVDERSSLRGAALMLQQHKLGCLPVIRDEQLVGIVTDSDFVAVSINLIEQLEESEEELLDDLQ